MIVMFMIDVFKLYDVLHYYILLVVANSFLIWVCVLARWDHSSSLPKSDNGVEESVGDAHLFWLKFCFSHFQRVD